ncbi:MAG: type I-G CRISPR-associated protein Csb2 [Candidatus Hinthialibacter sp.]
MIGISLRFPAGRFHATPWGRHVNEGIPEWPPSPWRIIRCIIFTWKMKYPSADESQIRSLLESFIHPPNFYLPPAASGHTRHYMPWYKKGPNDKTLVFDAFVSLDKASEAAVLWPDAALDESQREILSKLLENVGYLGRAESWCEARLLSEADAAEYAAKINCFPLNGSPPNGEFDIVRMLLPDPAAAFSNEHTKNRCDPAWHLCMETALLHEERWSDPPGSKWTPYLRRKDCFQPDSKRAVRSTRRERNMQAARYVLDSTVLPLVTETITLAEQTRRTLMGIYGRMFPQEDGTKGRSDIFSGKTADKRPLEGHCHAYYLPTDEDQDGRLDHLTVFTPQGFGRREIQALDKFRSLKREENLPELKLLLVGLGRVDDFQNLNVPIFQKQRIWRSITPFVLSRHPKKKKSGKLRLRENGLQIDGPEDQMLLEWKRRQELDPSLPDIKSLDVLEGLELKKYRSLRWIEFRRWRSRKPAPPVSLGFGFQITFSEPVAGPIVLGYGCHFGLGLFAPCEEGSNHGRGNERHFPTRLDSRADAE